MSTNIPDQYEDEDAISLIDLLLVFARHKGKIVVIPFLVGCVVAAYSLTVTEIYIASTTLLPSARKQSSAMSMLSQLGPLRDIARTKYGTGSYAEVLMTMVNSRRVQDKIIAKHELTKSKDGEELSMEKTRLKLTGATQVSLGRTDGIITISVGDEDPDKAAILANDYVKELEQLSQKLALTEASQRRAFLEKQLMEASAKLQVAEEAMKISQEKSGLIQLEEQGRAVIEAIATFQAQIAAKEVELGAIKLSATDDNPDVKRAVTILAQMRTQLASLERDNPEDKKSHSSIITTSKVPEVGLEYARRLRDLKYAETINQLLAQQYQMAKVGESQNAPILQVLDIAIAPEQRASPKRSQMVLMAIAASGFAMCLLVFILEAKNQAETDSEQAVKMAELKKSLWRI
jgi:uncharacterized protein involved in exopolysaccharide biosynthesis